MSIKNILCAYSGEAAHGSGLDHAIKLAKHHDAWLTGVVRHGRPMLERRFAAHVPDSLIQQLHEAGDTHVRELSQRFAEQTSAAGLQDRVDFVELDIASDVTITEIARNFDLIVTGPHSQDMSDEHLSANPDLIALRSGRPVLVIPNDYDAPGLAEHALVAWDGKRASARALGDAMQILENKAKVTVLSVGSKPVHDSDMLIRNLERHDIDVEYLVRPRSGSVAKTILGVAEEVGAKLLVMGAFEHSVFSHNLIGGVTTDVMQHSPIPAFLSH